MKFRLTGICIALVMLFTGSAFAQWSLDYQVQQNYSFQAVHFGSATVGYVVGSGGVIFKTINAGATWVQQTSPTTNQLNDVYALSATDVWAVGSTGTIIHTTDGTNWSVVATAGLTVTLNAVQGRGSTVWVGGGADNVACTIRYTTDGGTVWNAPVTNPSLDQCTDLSFVDANTGFASLDAGNGAKPIMFTTDGGVNWTLSTTVNYGAYPYTRYDLEGILAVSASTIIATGWGSFVGGQPTAILVSTDGGVNFNAPDPSYSWATYGYGYNATVFSDGDAIIVGGASQAAGFSIRGTGPSYSSWTRQPAFYGESINDVCAIPGTYNIVAVGDAGLIAYSSNRAASWSFAYDGGMPFQGIQDFVDMGKNRVLAAGAGGVILDFDLVAPRHYYRMASPNNWGPTTVGDFDYIVNPGGGANSDVLYVSGACKYLCKSYDAGLTWTELSHTNALQDGILGMYWFHPDTGIVVGHKLSGSSSRDEVIWKTVDGGVTLTEVLAGTLPGTVALQWNGVDFCKTNRNVGVVVGDDNYIRYTADGGVNWPLAVENIATATLDLEDVVMINATTAFAVGDGGILVKTTNGGANWTVQTVPWGAVNLTGIDYSTPNRLWVSGADQLLYYSADGGASWTNAAVDVIAGTEEVMAVDFQGTSGILWAGCHYSKVAIRTDAAPTDTDAPKLPFALNQNYPNPFNPSTRIDFAVDVDGRVVLNVYDVSGRLVATVMDENLKAGTYNVMFNADKLATGVYFYKLSTNAGDITRKMVVVR